MTSLIGLINACGGPLIDEDEPPGSEEEAVNSIGNFRAEKEFGDYKKDEIDSAKYYVHYDPTVKRFFYKFPELFDFEISEN